MGNVSSPKSSSAVKSRRLDRVQKSSRPILHRINLPEEVDDLGRELSSVVDPDGVINILARRLVKRYGVSTCGIWMVNAAEGMLELGAKAGKPHLPSSLEKTPINRTFLGKAAQRRLPQLLSKQDGARETLAGWARKHKLNHLAAYPLAHGSKAQGVLLVGCKKPPGDTLLSLFRMHASLASLALREAQLLSSAQLALKRLSFLVEATKALNSTLDLSDLLTRILNVAKTQAEAERGTIFLVDHEAGKIWSLIAHGLEEEEIHQPIGKGIAGHVAQTGETVIIRDAYRDARFNPEVDQRTGFRTRNLLCLPIRNKTSKIIAVLELLNKRQGPFTDDDTNFLLALSAHVALALENAQLHRSLLENERMEKELALARDIQRSLLPETAPLIDGFDIAVLDEPCYEVGGDYYDFLRLGPDSLLTVIADVEGKGVSSALVMSNLQAALRALVSHRPSLEEVAEGLNKIILAHTRTQKYLSIFLGLMDLRLKTLQYINCGHVPPVIVRPAHEAILLREGGLAIGMFENAQYERGQTKLQPGDILLLCTDGITESMDARQEEYGLERLIRRVRKVAEQSAAQILVSVSADVDRFARREINIDDKVMIAIKVL